jgi:hypothetical protein
MAEQAVDAGRDRGCERNFAESEGLRNSDYCVAQMGAAPFPRIASCDGLVLSKRACNLQKLEWRERNRGGL